MEDKQIISLFLHRSEDAIKSLEKKYEKLLFSVIGNILTDKEDIKECLNDTYLGVWNSVPPNHPEFLSAYVCRIAKNIAVKRYKKETAQKRNKEYRCTLDEIGQVLIDSEIEHTIEAHELGQYINSFLKTLNSMDRTLFINRYWFSYSNKQLAQIYQMKENNISVRLLRIRERLRKYLHERGYLYE